MNSESLGTLPCHANIIQRKVKIFSKAAARPLRFSEARIIYHFGLFWGKMVAGHATAHLMGCWHAWEIWGCVTILALSLDGVPDQSILPVHQLF